MPLPLWSCDQDLEVLIEMQGIDYTFLYDIITDHTLALTNDVPTHPIAYTDKSTTRTEQLPDSLTITGIVGCLKCPGADGFGTRIQDIAKTLKHISRLGTYDVNSFALITSHVWQMENMILTGATLNQTQSAIQKLTVTTTWVSASLVGTIQFPYFRRGGVIE